MGYGNRTQSKTMTGSQPQCIYQALFSQTKRPLPSANEHAAPSLSLQLHVPTNATTNAANADCILFLEHAFPAKLWQCCDDNANRNAFLGAGPDGYSFLGLDGADGQLSAANLSIPRPTTPAVAVAMQHGSAKLEHAYWRTCVVICFAMLRL
eukprot:NODE_763_length_1465_cov_41.547316_g628_i0.p1 GENE.NODE_763_length_1465_cov_41.547316_g628_i0~~NODE_763_length_1465_cov_41.547316_g628_i0.p1  ORF type:complete len:152 (+),score=14.12 NODE_763_length_1465_cov_41.547316_g628_i0:988-1443(+)